MNRITNKQPRAERVTIRTVAADAGVSVAAVSKVLRNAYGVSPALRGRVEASIAKLSYRPRAAARGMRGQTYTIGVVMGDIRNPFYPEIVDGVTAAFTPSQYQMLIGIGRASPTTESALVHAMVDRQMDGIIMIGQRMSSAEMHEVAGSIPAVVVGHHEPHATTFDSVNNDDRLGGRIVVEHLLAQGYRRPVMISLEQPNLTEVDVSIQRELGFRAMMVEAGLADQITIARVSDSPQAIEAAVKALFAGPNPPDAIFGWADYFAFEILSSLHRLGLRVPEDVAVIGYDNSPLCTFVQTDMSSVDQSGHEIGLQVARMLLERIDGRQTAEHYLVEPKIVARGSTAKSSRVR